jgi:hypothetical protein
VPEVALSISEQLFPELSQSSHAYEYEVGLFDHEPFEAVSVCPCSAVPLIAGSLVFTGAGGKTTAVCRDVADAGPPPFDAVTRDRIVCPTSAAFSTYLPDDAPPMREQFPPERLQSSHAYEYALGLFIHDPVLVANVCPSLAVPVTTGPARSLGASAGGGAIRLVAGVPLAYAETGQPRMRTPFHDPGNPLIRRFRERWLRHDACIW